MPHATRHGIKRVIEKEVAVTASRFHRNNPAGSPITVIAPPQFAAIIIAAPRINRCFRLGTILCMIVSIMTDVVKLSRFADNKKVIVDRVQSIFLLLRVFNKGVMKSKHPLLFSISTIVIVASKKRTISAALPTYGRKMLCEIKSFTIEPVCMAPSRNSSYSLGYRLVTKSVP